MGTLQWLRGWLSYRQTGVLALALGLLCADMALAATGNRAPDTSLLGSYLAGRHARGLNDTSVAVEYYRSALAIDPDNEILIEQAFLMELTEGQFDAAAKLATKLAASPSQNRMTRLYLGIVDFKAKRWSQADEHFKAANSGPIGELTSTLAQAWNQQAQQKSDEALQLIDVQRQAEWAQFYMRYHRALIADIGGRRAEARTNYERIFKTDNRTPRTALAYTQHAGNSGDFKLARSILKEHMDKGAGDAHPMAQALQQQLGGTATTPLPLLVDSAQDGMAEVFYGLGEALTSEGGISIGAIYLQMALYLKPDFPFALAALANVHETTKHYDQAIATYERIPLGTPLAASIDIRKAINLNLLERVDEAQSLLEDLAKRNPGDVKPLEALGSIMRARKRYDDAIGYYSRAITLIPKPEKRHWSYWYSRGTSYERVKKWPQAEADLQRALLLYPDQPMILNYLGYSWIDQNKNLKQGMALIEKAVALKPDDGYIVDSLGWAHYKLGNYKDAVRFLERAVELRPEDPVLNDHLGDSLWRVGREREARFQWDQSLTLKPEPEDATRTKRKLEQGLVEKRPAPVAKTKQQARTEPPRRRVQTNLESTPPPAKPFNPFN
jgi:tetratricopeptide (TPR) repeat protein